MSAFEKAQERDMVLFVGSYLQSQRVAIDKLSSSLDKKLTACVLVSVVDPTALKRIAKDPRAVVLICDLSSTPAVQTALAPYRHRFLAVTCRAERNIPMLKTIIPHVPYLNTPTETSLDWTTDKIKMRQLLRGYDKAISPKFLVVHDALPETLERIEKTIGFPVIIKPSGLASSLLISLCYHHEELEQSLKNTVSKIDLVYKKKKGRGEPRILVEEFMEGAMYSVDSYVNQRGTVYHAPLVHVRTGRAVGYSDFFGYMRITPVRLKQHKVDAACRVAEKAIEALNLRSTTCHIELMKTEDGWKVIEVGPRIGGFRQAMYSLSYGIDHSLNDIAIRMPRKPILPKRVQAYTAVLQFYPRTKGRLQALSGTNKARKLESFQRIEIRKKIGDMCDFASNGDDPVLDITLCNRDRSRLLADVRRLEQAIQIQIKKPLRKAN